MATVLTSSTTAGLDDPIGWQVWQVLTVVVAATLLTVGIVRSLRTRRLDVLLLMTISGASAFWLETYGDWGGYVLYSPRFAQVTWWGPTPWTSPVKAWWFIAGYAFFYPAIYGLMLGALRIVRSRRPSVNPYIAAVVLAFPVFYVFDLIFEGTTTALGYWTYTYSFGPHLSIGKGSFPLLWPVILQAPFLALAGIALIWRDDRGRDVFHRVAARAREGWPRELAVAGGWIVATNLALILTVEGPMVALRLLAGPPSNLVP